MTRTLRIALVPGDGIGPEVIAQAVRVLEAVSARRPIAFEFTRYPFGADHYLATGEMLPATALEEMRSHDAILLGAIGDPRVETGLLERAIIAGIRFGLDLYANLRPIKLYDARLTPLKDRGPTELDLVCVRENTEDLYVGIGGHFRRGTPEEIAIAEMVLTRKGTERVLRYAFELARSRPRRKLTLIDKANAIRAFDLWRRVFEEVGAEYPDVTRDCQYIDAACMRLVLEPERFDVCVTSNVFGDILTDLGAALVGGLGLAASGNLHPGRVSMFEPVHGSAPEYAGKQTACPLAAILAAQMMLAHLGEGEAAAAVETAVAGSLVEGEIPSVLVGSSLSTEEMGSIVVRRLRDL